MLWCVFSNFILCKHAREAENDLPKSNSYGKNVIALVLQYMAVRISHPGIQELLKATSLTHDPCSIADHLQGSNSPNANQTVPEISTIDLKPDCIDKRFWRNISEKDRNNILNNSTTCQIINGEQITNLPPIGYQLMPKVAFEELEIFICYNYGTDLEAMILDGGFTDPVWIEDFTSNFDNLTEQSCKTILEDYSE